MKKPYSRLYIEITNMCNMSCSFCAKNQRPNKIMSVEEFRHVVEEVAPVTNYIYLHVLGEPLTHSDLEEFIAIGHENQLKVNITTNGTLLAKRREMLVNAPGLRKISVSLHSIEEGSLNANEQYLKEVAEFAKEFTAAGKLCELRLWNIGAGDDYNKTVVQPFFDYLGIQEDEKQEVVERIGETGTITFWPGLFLGKSERFAWPSMSAPLTNHPTYCHGAGAQLGILSDGTVIPCCLDSLGDVNLGNVFEKPLKEILEGERVVAMKEGFRRRQPSEELCRRCEYATRF